MTASGPSTATTSFVITSERLHIIAFDPGEMTGWARGFVDSGSLFITANGYNPWKSVVIAFARAQWAEKPAYDRVVYESWRLRADAAMKLVGSDLQSSQFIGGMKLVAWWSQLQGNPIEIATNEPGNKPAIDGWMNAAGQGDYLPSSDVEHNRDAIRHICFDAVSRLNIPEANIYYLEDANDAR